MPLLDSVVVVNNDPSMAPTLCDVCGTTRPLGEMKSIAWVYRLPGLQAPGVGYPPHQCPDLQHFGCTHEHAMLALLCCLFEHMQGNYDGKEQGYTHPVLTDLKARLQQDLLMLVQEEKKEAIDGTAETSEG